jgi:hypothetical protein
MLSVALRSNPEILQAEAKVRQAEADLNQARLKVMEEVVTAFHEREKQQAAIRSAEQSYMATRQRVESGTTHESELIVAEQALVESRSKLVQNEARARYLLGLGGLAAVAAGTGAPEATPAGRPPRERPPIPERYREALEKKMSRPIALHTAGELAASLEEELGSQVINTLGDAAWNTGVRLEEQPLRVALTAAHDLCGVVLVFRDYGVLLTTGQRAATMNAPTFPEDIPLGEGEPR